ncbi:MAG: hypothetical protein JOY51_07705 [Nevskia sp.]|nr:hypothetical protein [Nevskia sp.]
MQQLSGLDSMFLNLETAGAPMHIGCLSLLDLAHAPAGCGFEAVRRRIGERPHLLPGFRRRPLSLPLNLAPPLWVEDPDLADLEQAAGIAAAPRRPHASSAPARRRSAGAGKSERKHAQ